MPSPAVKPSPLPRPARAGGDHPSPDQPRWLAVDDEEAPARPALTRRRIVMSAIQLVEIEGLEALTMRRVASALKVTPMSLYNHVADKAELVDLMVDFIIGKVVSHTDDDAGDWESRLRAQFNRNYQVWKAHPGIVRVYAEGVTLGPNGLANLERAVGILRDGGFNDEDAGRAVLMLYRWSMATLLVGRTRPVSRDGGWDPPPRTREERLHAYFAALPRELIPNLDATMMYMSGTSIEFGLDIIIAGLKARLAATTAGSDGTIASASPVPEPL